MAKDFFRTFVDQLGCEDTTLASDGTSAAEFSGFIDTGSYILNAGLSGSLFGGMPNNEALVIAGESTTGKTFFTLGIIKNFLDSDPKARVAYFDTESAVTNDMLTERGIDPSRIMKSEPDSIERFRTVAIKILDNYGALDEKNRFPLLMILDSLSMLPSKKEITDITEGKDTKDMTKAQLIKGAFRVLRLKMAKLNVAIIVTNHVYAVIGAYVPTKEMGGGSGAKYASDAVAFLSKKGEKGEDNKLIGNVIHVNMKKSRLSKEGTKFDTRILYSGGLDRYYGLLQLAVDAGLVKKIASKYEFPDGTKAFEKAILRNPSQFWTKDVLTDLDIYVQKTFKYTAGEDVPVDDDDDDDEDTENE